MRKKSALRKKREKIEMTIEWSSYIAVVGLLVVEMVALIVAIVR